MPRIPTLDAPSVAPSITPGARFDAPQMGNAAAEQAQRTGQAMASASDALQNLQVEFTKPIVREAMNSAINIGMEFETGDGGFMHLKGKDAVGREVPLDIEYAKAYQSRLDEIRDKLPNQMAKEAFAAETGNLVRSFHGRVTNHMVKEQGVYQQSQLEGQAATGARLMTERYDSPEEWANGRNAVYEAVSEANKGMDPEYIAEQARARLSPTHAVIVSQMLEAGQAQAAQDYFAKVSDDLTGEAKAKLSAAIATSATEIEGQQAAREAIATAGPDWTLRDIDQKLVERFGSNPKALSQARQEAKYQRDLMDSAKRETEAQLLGPVQAAVADARLNGRRVDRNALKGQLGMMRVTRPDLYEKASAAIDAHDDELRNERQAAEDRARAARDLALQNGVKGEESSASAWYTLKTNPAALRAADLMAMRSAGVLSERHFNNLAEDQSSLRAKKMDDSSILSDKAAVDMVLNGAKIETSGKNIDPQKLGMFYERFNQRVREAGRPLNQQEKVDVARDLLGEVVKKREYWFDTTQKAFEIAVPPTERAAIISALRRAGKPVTEANITTLYQSWQSK